MNHEYKYADLREEDRNSLIPAFKRTLPSILPSAEDERRKMLNWPSVEEQEDYWTLRDEGRSDGYGESYGERNV